MSTTAATEQNMPAQSTPAIRIEVDGEVSELGDFLRANADDQDVCDWASSARAGDVFPAIVSCRAIAA